MVGTCSGEGIVYDYVGYDERLKPEVVRIRLYVSDKGVGNQRSEFKISPVDSKLELYNVHVLINVNV